MVGRLGPNSGLVGALAPRLAVKKFFHRWLRRKNLRLALILGLWVSPISTPCYHFFSHQVFYVIFFAYFTWVIQMRVCTIPCDSMIRLRNSLSGSLSRALPFAIQVLKRSHAWSLIMLMTTWTCSFSDSPPHNPHNWHCLPAWHCLSES
jgi:hypothetical protein